MQFYLFQYVPALHQEFQLVLLSQNLREHVRKLLLQLGFLLADLEKGFIIHCQLLLLRLEVLAHLLLSSLERPLSPFQLELVQLNLVLLRRLGLLQRLYLVHLQVVVTQRSGKFALSLDERPCRLAFAWAKCLRKKPQLLLCHP